MCNLDEFHSCSDLTSLTSLYRDLPELQPRIAQAVSRQFSTAAARVRAQIMWVLW
jgi:hypothetical protein